ncbi:MAG: alpha/beta hydrolase [Pseudomonadota bacterium]
MPFERQADLIKIAYAMVVEPQRLEELDRLLGERLDAHYQGARPAITEQALFSDVEGHFDHAFELFQKQAAAKQVGQSVGQRGGMGDQRDWLLIEQDGRVRSLGEVAAKTLNLQPGERLTQELFEHNGHSQFLKSLRTIDSPGRGAPFVFTLLHPETGKPHRYVMRWDPSDPDGAVGEALPLDMHWTDRTGRAFGRAFKLSGAEMSITRAIVDGVSLRDLASERRRSLGTLRNQTKHLLSKLDLSSQSELITLYSGFSKISDLDHLGKSRAFGNDPRREISVMTLSSGRKISYDVYGEENGRPVLFLHPMFGGTGLTAAMKDAVLKAGLRLYMPWRPYYGDTDGEGEGLNMLLAFAASLGEFMDRLKLGTCPLLASNGATPLAFAALKQLPARFTKLVLTGANVPLTRPEQFWAMGFHQRVPLYLARHAPKLVEMYIRSVIAKLDAGYDEAYARRYFAECLIDLETLISPEFKQMARDALSYTFINGHKAGVQELFTNSMDWSQIVEPSSDLPISLYTGAADTVHSPAMVAPFVDAHANMTLHVIDGAASLLIAQKPEIIFPAL